MSVYHQEGKDLQESFDCAGELLKSRYREWYLTLTQLPTWGEDIDKQVQLYISSVQNVALANLNWRFVNVIFFPILRADNISITTVTVQKDIGMGTITKSGSLGLSLFHLMLQRHHEDINILNSMADQRLTGLFQSAHQDIIFREHWPERPSNFFLHLASCMHSRI